MRHAAVTRSGLGVGTAFNLLGPLTNPAQPTYAAVGVADPRTAPILAGVFAGRGRPAAVFRGDDGLDELTLATTSTVWWVRDGVVTRGRPRPRPSSGSRTARSRRCAVVTRRSTRRSPATPSAGRPVRCATRSSSTPGMALAVADWPEGAEVSREALTVAVRRGIDRAEEAVDSGAATALLERWVEVTRALSAG